MKKQLITVLAGAALTALCSMPVFAGGWRQDGASSDDWSDRVEQLHLIASDLEDLYASSGLKGLLTVHVCAGSKGAVRLTSQNGSIVYNAAEDAGFERPESTQMNAFIEIVQNTLKNTDYSILSGVVPGSVPVLSGSWHLRQSDHPAVRRIRG